MAITITIQKILDSSRNVIIKAIITGTSDGTAILYNTDDYIGDVRNVKITKIKYELQGFSAYLSFEDINMLSLSANNPTAIDFTDMGGMLHSNPPQTGNITITTNGLGVGDIGTIILFIKKKSQIYTTLPTVYRVTASGALRVTASGDDRITAS